VATITQYLYYRETPDVVEKAKKMHAKYPELKECAALVKLGLTAADKVSVTHSTGLYYHIAWLWSLVHSLDFWLYPLVA